MLVGGQPTSRRGLSFVGLSEWLCCWTRGLLSISPAFNTPDELAFVAAASRIRSSSCSLPAFCVSSRLLQSHDSKASIAAPEQSSWCLPERQVSSLSLAPGRRRLEISYCRGAATGHRKAHRWSKVAESVFDPASKTASSAEALDPLVCSIHLSPSWPQVRIKIISAYYFSSHVRAWVTLAPCRPPSGRERRTRRARAQPAAGQPMSNCYRL